MKEGTMKRLWNYIGHHKKLLAGVFFCGIAGNLLVLAGPLLVGAGIDLIVGPDQVDFQGLAGIIAILLVLYLLSSLFQWLMGILSNIVANRTVLAMRRDAFRKLSKLPLRFFDSTPHGDVINRMTNDIDAVADGLFQGITQIISGVITIVGVFGFMLYINKLITLIVVLITPVCFVIAYLIAKNSGRMFRKQSQVMGELNGYAEEIIGSQKIVKAFGYEDRAYEHFSRVNQELYDWGKNAQFYSSLTNPTTRLVNNIAYISVTVVGGFLAVAGRLTVGNIASFLTYSNQFAKPINEITSVTTQLQAAVASAGRIFMLLDEEEESGQTIVETISEKKGEIEFSHVDFSYQADTPLIRDLNLRAKPGEMVAIVGPTGAGKSTLVNLLMRFYEVDAGTITVDGVDIRNLERDQLRLMYGMVLQESWLFNGTVAENIAYGKPDASREEIIQAARAAHAHNFIKRLRHGYDTPIEENGQNLSVGEKQLMTIARVLLIDPPMLILDEATSSIDSRTEIEIQKAFAQMMKNRTSFIIAHRLSTIREADTILVMNHGKIIEQGNHQELLEKEGFYHKLYNSQFQDTDEATG